MIRLFLTDGNFLARGFTHWAGCGIGLKGIGTRRPYQRALHDSGPRPKGARLPHQNLAAHRTGARPDHRGRRPVVSVLCHWLDLANTEIAGKLFTSKRTIKIHCQIIMDKTQTRNTAALIKPVASGELLRE